MLTCRQIPEVLAEPHLSFQRKLQLKFHLFICDRCRQLKRQWEAVQKGLHRYVDKHEPLDPALAKKLVDEFLKKK